MAKERKIGRQKAVSDLKRELILDAARKVFEADGLKGHRFARLPPARATRLRRCIFTSSRSRRSTRDPLQLPENLGCHQPRGFARQDPAGGCGRGDAFFATMPTIRETSISASICFAAG
jgi:hypothetical protein